MGSEMCIRDRHDVALDLEAGGQLAALLGEVMGDDAELLDRLVACLLYTSDAADERSSVDLGGRRIIKKKNIYKRQGVSMLWTNKAKNTNVREL